MSAVELMEVQGKYQSYPDYKDSGVEWLGKVPREWILRRLKFLCEVSTGDRDTVHKEESGQYPFFVRSETVERISTYSFDGEAVLTAGDGAIGKIFHHINGRFDFHQRVYKFSNFKCIDGRYFYYYISTNLAEEVVTLSAKTTVDSLRLPMLQNFVFAFPELEYQHTIVAFLDYETARIDKLLAQQQRLIELLKEKRQAVISHAVTKGLNPNAPMKDSGVEWLGEVPKHWNILKFNHCANIRNGQVDPTAAPYNDYILIAPNHIESGTGRLLEKQTAEEQGADSGKYICKLGEVVYSKIRPALAKVCISPENNVICSADMYPINGKNGLNNDFLMWFLLCDSFTRFAVNQADRVAMPKINRDSLGECRIPVPPKLEQNRIVTLIKHKTAVLDALINKSSKTILLMQERRTALVSAAVTGKIDLRGWSKPTEEVAT